MEIAHIAVLDADARIRGLLGRYLEQQAYRTSQLRTRKELYDLLAAGRVDLVILDPALPGEDGLALLRDIAVKSAIPVIVTSHSDDWIEAVVDLEAGADDFIAKPFHLREVLARVHSVLRRQATGAAEGSNETPAVAIFEGWRIDTLRRELYRPPNGELVRLTTSEFDLLNVLVARAGRPLSRDQLIDLMKGREWVAFDRSIDTLVGRLRKKVEKDPARPALIKTIRGVGYMFAAKVERA